MDFRMEPKIEFRMEPLPMETKMETHKPPEQMAPPPPVSQQSMPTTAMDYSCELCPYRASRKGNLQTHKDAVHGNVRY